MNIYEAVVGGLNLPARNRHSASTKLPPLNDGYLN